MKERIIQKFYSDKTVLYEVQHKTFLFGWKTIYIDCALYKIPAIFNTLDEAKKFVNPLEKKKLLRIFVLN